MTHIRDLLSAGPTYSFEFFPPRTPAAVETLRQTLADLGPLKPSFVSVTYGAGGTTRELTHEIVAEIQHDTDLTAMAHLTCAAHTRAQLTEIVTRYRDAGVVNVLALRGDPPKHLVDELPAGELEYASDLVALVRDVGDVSVGVAVHPEGHPASGDRESDLDHQAQKLQVADFGISQFFFEAPIWRRFVSEIRTRGVDTPLLPGIMPVTNVKSVKRMAELSGSAFPTWLEDRLRTRDDPEYQFKVGVEAATELCRQLLDDGADGLHFYTLNRSPATQQIYAALGLGPTGTEA